MILCIVGDQAMRLSHHGIIEKTCLMYSLECLKSYSEMTMSSLIAKNFLVALILYYFIRIIIKHLWGSYFCFLWGPPVLDQFKNQSGPLSCI